MKLSGFRVESPALGVEVWEAGEFTLSLAQVVKYKLTSGQSVPAHLKPLVDRFEESRSLEEMAAPVAYRLADGSLRRIDRGLVSAASLMALVDFLADRYEPLAGGQLEHYLSRARAAGASRDAVRQELERFCQKERAYLRRRSRLRNNLQMGIEDSPILAPNDDDRSLSRLQTTAGTCVFTQSEHQLLCYDFEMKVGGRAVPRRAWALTAESRDEPVLFWDGSTMRAFRSIDRLPRNFLHRVDREGTSLWPLHALPVGAPELEPRFLLRVPPAEELGAAREKKPDHEVLSGAAFLFDSRAAVRLPSERTRLPFFDDPGIARFVLARTTRTGFYIPGGAPAEGAGEERAGCVLVGALPSVGIPELRSRMG